MHLNLNLLLQHTMCRSSNELVSIHYYICFIERTIFICNLKLYVRVVAFLWLCLTKSSMRKGSTRSYWIEVEYFKAQKLPGKFRRSFCSYDVLYKIHKWIQWTKLCNKQQRRKEFTYEIQAHYMAHTYGKLQIVFTMDTKQTLPKSFEYRTKERCNAND